MTTTTIGNYDAQDIRSMLALFKAVPGDAMDDNMPEIAMASLEDCIVKGFAFINQQGLAIPFVSMPLFVLADEAYGIDREVNNQTFWKSFERVRDMDPREYVIAQITHYFSTYGMENLGLKACPMVPAQNLEIPDNILPANRLTVLRLVSESTMLDMINSYARHTVAPSTQRIEQFKPLMKYLTIKTDDIKSFELQVIKHDMNGTVPENPQSFLRYLVYKTTGQTLLIKNRNLRRAIQSAALDCTKACLPYEYLSKADKTALASIFFRNKPIFLAFKEFEGCAPIINRIRRLADTYHKPLSDVSVQNFAALVIGNRIDDANKIIAKSSNRELIKLYNYLAYRCFEPNNKAPGVYNVRNGRTFVRKDVPQYDVDSLYRLGQAKRMVLNQLVRRLSPVLKDKKFYVPEYMDYAAPVSEKQFIGNIPWGSSIKTFNPNEAFTVGVSWFDQQGQRVDIDLHLSSATKHYGWNGGYTDGQDIVFTGDMTAAPEPNGAAEAYYFKPGQEKYILSANLYSGPANAEFKMYMTSKKPIVPSQMDWGYRREHPYTFDPADAMFTPIPMKFDNSNGTNLGLFADGCFYFYGGSISQGIVPTGNYEDFINGLSTRLAYNLTIDDILAVTSAKMISEEELAEMDEEERKEVISLAPADLTATILLDIVDGNL